MAMQSGVSPLVCNEVLVCNEGPSGVKVRVSASKGPQIQPSGRVTGVPLSELRQRHGGDEFTLLDPFWGNTHHISLKPWATADPQATYITIAFALGGGTPRGK